MTGEMFDLYKWIDDQGVFLFDRQLPFSNGDSKAVTICLDDSETYGVFLDRRRLETSAEARTALGHECGHCATGTTHKLYGTQELIAHHENRANKWAIKKLVPEDELERAVARGCTEVWELAEYFNVTEDCIRKAICWYKYGNLNPELYL